MQRFGSSALRRSSAGGVARLAVPFSHASPALVVPRREASSVQSPTTGSAEASRSPAKPSAAGATQAAPELDSKAAEQVRLAQELGEQAFSENTEILKKVAFRGLRAFVMCAVGVATFMWAMKKKKQERQADALPGVEAPHAAHAEGHDDPTQRYLQEMRGLGFDVETLEEELEQERVAKVSGAHERSTTAHLTSSPHGVEEIAVPINVTDDGSRDRCAFLETGESTDAHAPPCASAQEPACDSCRFSSVVSASLATPDAVPQVGALAPAPVPCLQAPPSCAFVDVPPSAIPARRLKNVYDGTMHLPPGTTKRALGRLRIVWCCVVTAESWHALFVGLPILFFTTLFVTVVVPRGEWLTYVFTALFTTISVTCLTLSVTLDPGVIPPAPQSQQPTQSTAVMVGGQPVLCKVCTTCHIIRPPRSTHCRFCDVCVEEFDHHCGIIGSCVGKRTFRFFGGFFVITSFLVLYIFIRSFIILVSTDFKPSNERPHLIWLAASCTLCIVAAVIGAILVMPCAGRYIMLSASNSTVKETMRTQRQQTQSGEQPPGVVPIAEAKSGNYCVNLLRRLFSPIGRSRIPFDYYV